MPDTATLRSMIASLYPDNGLQEITAGRLREGLRYIADLLDVPLDSDLRFRDLPDLLATDKVFDPGTVLVTESEGFAYEVVSAAGDLVSASGLQLRILPDANGVFPAAAMGLAMDGVTNDVPKIQALGQRIANSGGGVLRLPAGDIGWGQRLEITLPATTTFATRYLGFGLVGAGAGLTKCHLPNTNTAGGVRITRRSRPQVVGVKDIGWYSYQPRGNNASQPATTSGVGIWIASEWNPDNPTAMGWGTDPHKQVVVRDCFVGSGSGLGYGRWSGCCYVEFAFFASIEGNSFENNHWSAPTDAVPHFETPPAGWDYSFGLELKECYTPEVLNNRIKGRWGYCTRIWSPYQPAFEDFAVVNNVFDGQSHIALEVACKNEGYVAPALGEPGGRIALNHFNAHRYDVRLENIRHTSFTGNFTHLATQADLSGWFKYWDETGLRLVNCQAMQVIGNCWEEGGHYTNVNDCSRAVWLDAGCADITFDANSHGSAGIAYDCSAAEPMTITFGPGDNFGFRQGDGNWRYPTIYHHMRTNIRQRVHAPPQDISSAIALTIGGTALAAGSYATRQAVLTRRGDTAEITINITLSSKEGLTGTILITGLPPHVPLYPTAMTVGTMSGDTGLSAHRSMRALIQANGDISLRYTNDSSSPYADVALGGAQITDTFSIVLTGTYTLAGARNITRIG